MSFEAVNWAVKLKDERLTSSKKFLLVIMGNYCNENGYSYPSAKRLEDDTCMDRKTILKALTELEKEGFITDTGKRCGVTKQVRVYTLNVNGPKNGTIPIFPRNDPNFPEERSQNWDTEPSVEPSRNHQRGDSNESPPLKAPKKERQRMQKPNMGECMNEACGMGMTALEGEKFYNHHTAKGWVMGKLGVPMADWRAAMRTWKINAAAFAKEKPTADVGPARPSWEEGRAEQERRHALRREERKTV